MKKFLIFSILVVLLTTSYAQVAVIPVIRVATSTTTFPYGLPVGTQIVDVSTNDIYLLTAYASPGESISTASGIETIHPGAGFWEQTDNFIYPATLTDSVGIGTETPSAILEVAGRISLLTSSGNNTIIGNSSGTSITTGTLNTIFGQVSGRYLTSGEGNVLMGFAAGNVLTSASGNISLGKYSLYEDSTGNYNVAIGDYAGASLKNGAGNIMIGDGAGNYDAYFETNTANILIGRNTRPSADGTTNEVVLGPYAIGNGSHTLTLGDDNVTDVYIGEAGEATLQVGRIITNGLGGSVFIGEDAGLSDDLTSNSNVRVGNNTGKDNVTGVQNVSAGISAAYNNIDGNYNTAIGASSQYEPISGDNNTSVGFLSLNGAFNSDFSYNSGFGSYSMQYISTGSYNTGVGANTLKHLTTGSYNIGVGHDAGRKYGSGTSYNTTSKNSIFIGYDTRASANGDTNEIVIGSNAIGNGHNTVTLGDDNVTDIYLNEAGTAKLHASTLAISGEILTDSDSLIDAGTVKAYVDAAVIAAGSPLWEVGGSGTQLIIQDDVNLRENDLTHVQDISLTVNGHSTISGSQKLSSGANDLTIQSGDAYTTTVAGGHLKLTAGLGGATSGSPTGGNVYVYGGNSADDGSVILGYDGSARIGFVGVGRVPSIGLDVNGFLGLKNSSSISADSIVGTITDSDSSIPTSGAIVDYLASLGYFEPAFSNVYVAAGSARTVSASNTWFTVIGWTEKKSSNVTVTDSILTVGVAGEYAVDVASSFSYDTDGATVRVAVFLNDVEQTHLEFEVDAPTVGQIAGPITGILTCAKDDVIKLKFRVTSTGDFTNAYGNFRIFKISN